MSSHPSLIAERCATCGRETSHEVRECSAEALPESVSVEGPYLFKMTVRCIGCRNDKTLSHTGSWHEVVEYLVEKRVADWIPEILSHRGVEPPVEPVTHIERNAHLLGSTSALVRNTYLEVVRAVESGPPLIGASALNLLLAAICDEFGITGATLETRVLRLVETEASIAPLDEAKRLWGLTRFPRMNISDLIGLTRTDLIEAIHACELLVRVRISLTTLESS